MSKVALSPAEIILKPIFMEYEKKNWELHKQFANFSDKPGMAT